MRPSIPEQLITTTRLFIYFVKFKKKKTAYTLELKHHFRHSAPSSGSEECDAWRDRVLALEAELRTTRVAASSEHIGRNFFTCCARCLTHTSYTFSRASRAQVRRFHIYTEAGKAAEEAASDVGSQGSQEGSCARGMRGCAVRVDPKVQRKDPRAQRESCVLPLKKLRVVPVVVAYYMRIVVGPSSPSPRINCGLFSSLHALDAASAVFPPDTALVAVATIRCIDVLHGLLARATSPVAPDTPLDPTPHEALNGIERTLPHVLRAAISTLDRADLDPSSVAGIRWYVDPDDDPAQRLPNDTISALDLVLGRVATSLLVPAVRAIVPCTLAKTERILSSSSSRRGGGGASADGADLLGVVGAALEALSGRPHIALHERVALEAVRALTSLIVDQPSQQTPAQRIHRIARKDALHFLCDAVLLSLRRTVPAAAPPGEMLGLALETALGELALTLTARSGLDVVEEQRVLVVLERAWSVGRRVGNIGGGDAGSDESMDAGGSDVHGQDVDATMKDVDGEDCERDDQR